MWPMVFVMRLTGKTARWGTSFLASVLVATVLVLGGGATKPVDVSAAAGSTYLCTGYSGCRSAGYSDGGYGAVNNRMYWRMYSGHNCTNYVAYRMIRAGMSSSRPWVGGGNASEWGKHMREITDQVPAVGAVAWWGRYSNGSGSAGHVAYVEKVVSDTEIIISEDSWGGTFHWRRITKSSGRWPTGFIHFVDKAITNETRPTIIGDPTVGNTLKLTNGRWSTRPTRLDREWLVDGVPTGVKKVTYVPAPADRNKTITVSVTASHAGYTSATATSKATAAVTAGAFTLEEQPSVTGEPLVDEVLTANPGTWSPEPKVMGWRWFADGKRLAHNTEQLVLTEELVGREISVSPVARRGGYVAAAAPRVSAGKVVEGHIESTRPFAVRGKRMIGETLTVREGTYTPTDATPAYQWLRDGVPVARATRPAYRLTRADVGARISLQVTLTRKNYTSAVSEAPTVGVVRSPAIIKIVPSSRRGAAVAWVRVTARGQAPVAGTVRIRIGPRARTVRLVDGKATWRLARPAGTYPVKVRYNGMTAVPPAHASSTVRVR